MRHRFACVAAILALASIAVAQTGRWNGVQYPEHVRTTTAYNACRQPNNLQATCAKCCKRLYESGEHNDRDNKICQ